VTQAPAAPSSRRPLDPQDRQWWRTAVVYQVYPRSFADSTGDGVGDLPGVTARLDHLADLGVDALWLSPVYRSPMADGGYDVADYRSVDPLFGTVDDAERLLEAAHARGLRVLMDLVPNHTSDEHAWFRAALAAGPGSRERARYLFRDGRGERGEQPPNGWRSVFGGPAWTRVPGPDGTSTEGGQWYLHLFDARQPDLDWSNPEVRAEFEDVLRFWFDKGFDGFRIDVAHGLVKAPGLPEWDRDHRMLDGEATADAPMWDQEGVHEVYRSWRRIADEHGGRVLVAEAWVEPPERLARYLRPDELHQAFAFALLESPWRVGDLRSRIDAALATTAAVGAPVTWVLSNHDVVRHTTRLALDPDRPRPNGIGAADPQPDQELGLRRGRAATLVMLALPGAAYLYQGEELGLPEHTTLPDEVRQDPTFFRERGAVAGRDGCRVPLPWEAAAPGCGFGPGGRTWLPQPESFARLAADAQRGVAGSTLELYREALARRRELGLGAGRLAWVDEPWARGEVLALRVRRPDATEVLVVANLGAEPVALPPGARVLLASGALETAGRVPQDVAVWAAEDRSGR
jgi:alpha-glucosidase